MACPFCNSASFTALKKATQLSYKRFQCRSCGKNYNQRTGTPFNYLEYPTEIVFQAAVHYIRYKLSLWDIVEMFQMRGFTFTHETVRDWVERFGGYLTTYLKKRRRGSANDRWHVDETYIKVKGKPVYYYRAIDKHGNFIDGMISKHRDLEAAERFLKQAIETTGITPECVTTGGLDSYPRAIKQSCGEKAQHRTSRYMNNRIEQDHRGIKSRYKPMLGFKTVESASAFCPLCDEVRQHFKCRNVMKEEVSLPQCREHFTTQLHELYDAFLMCPLVSGTATTLLPAC
jgi:putative transposase